MGKIRRHLCDGASFDDFKHEAAEFAAGRISAEAYHARASALFHMFRSLESQYTAASRAHFSRLRKLQPRCMTTLQNQHSDDKVQAES